MMRGGGGEGEKSSQIQDAISVKARSWLAIRVIHRSARKKKKANFQQLSRLRAALPTGRLVPDGAGPCVRLLTRACGSTLGSTLLKSAALCGLFTPNSAHCWMRCQRRAGRRRFLWKKKGGGDAGRAQTRLTSSTYRNSCFLRLVIRLGDGTADLQVAGGGATGGGRPPQCPVIYSDTSINISGLGSYSKFSLMFVVNLLCAYDGQFRSVLWNWHFLLDHLLLAIRQDDKCFCSINVTTWNTLIFDWCTLNISPLYRKATK